MRNLGGVAVTLICAGLVACGDSTGGGDGDDGSGGAGSAGALVGSGAGADGSGTPSAAAGSPGEPLGAEHQGEYHLGPVEWEGSFWNACAPYPPEIQALEGDLLAGVSNEVGADGSHCDACIEIETATGRTVIARVVTYGVTQAPGNIDVSQAVFDAIHTGENPRTMTWRTVTCPGTAPLAFQYQTGAHAYWTSLWVRNPRVAIATVEVTSANHPEPFALRRGPDGTFTDDGGFGAGPFTLRVTGVDGSSVEESFDGFEPGALVTGTQNL